MNLSASKRVEPEGPPRRKVRWLRRTGWILGGLLGLLCLLGAAGAVYNAAATARDQRRFPPPGRLVNVEGLRLHLDCRGQGDPTVVLESGIGDPALAWTLVQPEVARFTRACSYDRAGAGYSDEPRYDRARARDGRALVGDLHALLSAAGVTGPYVLVGHSFGGLLVRLFAATFPAEAVGVVLVDGGHEDQRAYLKARVPAAYRAATLQRALRLGLKVNRFGILRLRPAEAGLDPSAPMYRRLPSTTLQAFTFLKLQTKALRANLAEFDTDTLEETLTQVRAAGTLGDRPLVVLSAGVVAGDLSPADAEAYRRLWLGELQPALARLSTRGRLVVVHDSGHRIPFERPDAVIEAVRAVVGEARQ